ncbi:obscurin-like protein 1 isoform X5 [Pangasianodon hypophthalmus]|uniref:obscurin-like protein 1 isoform X5 n=1 Tax=Pangasianodon hypophthalmus TaxID=310915 RepID=UPI0023072383|nr:obscurin-like protein 1 isoform X5 [Pangasianodon hypophthalmus]
MDVFGGAPRFLAYPRPVVVQSGTDAVLKCQISGDPRPAVIWERNNEKIHPGGRYRLFEDGNIYNLIITVVTAEDSGQYICKAKNCIGETYAAATLKVEGEAQEMELREENKPRFLIKPLSTRVGRGDDAVFSCKLWGKPRPEVVWEKDGKKLNEIFESTHFSVGYQDGGWFQLKIFKTRAPDGGVYTCKARNEFGESLAGAVLLVDAGPGHEDEGNRNGYTNGHWKAHQGKQRSSRHVVTRLKEDPVLTSAKVKMFAVTEGKHAKFRCYVTGKPKPEIIWRKDGRIILSGRRYLLYEDREGYFTLKVLYCKQQDNGVYVCAASNTAGQTLSAVHLFVKEPPVRFKQPLNDLEVWERDLAILECEVPEDSVPITWYLEDRRLQPGAKYGMEEWGTKRRLTIRDMGVDDDGIYLCEMPDGGRSIAEVTVKGTIVRKLPRKVDVLEGENAAFCVEVEEEEMDIHWYKDGTELRETHQTIIKSFGRTHILVFVNTTPQDSGMVIFYVGRSKTSSQLRVKAVRQCPPSCPVGVQINTERANAALLSWVPAQDCRKNPPSGYILERQEIGSQEWLQCLTTDSATSVEILGDSVPCEADYRFRICSINKYGRSGYVEFPRAVHLVPVAKIQAPLQDALVPEGQDAYFSIELSASVIGTWFWNGNQVQEDERFLIRRSRTHQSLRIRGVRDTDNGAEITFIAYGIRDSAALYIQAPLVKFTPLSEMDRNKFVEVGNPIVLYCELSDPEAPVRWYKNGVELHSVEGLHIQSEGTMRRIVIQSAEFCHSGVYSCDAIDDVIRFNVEVEAPPVRFIALPDLDRNKSIEAGCPIVLQCELSDPSAQVFWYKDEAKLLPQTGLDFQSNGTKRALVVEKADFFHSGVYSCKTKGAAVQFNVEIKAPPVRFSAGPETERRKCIEAGSTIVLQCEISDSSGQVRWFKDGKQILTQSCVDFQSEGCIRRLIIESAALSHSGVYRCTTKDDIIEFQVEIKAVPVRFSTVPEVEKSKCIEAGSCFELRCEVSDPTADVHWYKDETEILTDTGWDIQAEGTLRMLVVQSAEPSHSGLYSCNMPDDSVQFTVDIKAPPVKFSAFPGVVKNQLFEADYPTEPHCEISDPPAKVCWYEDGVELLSKSQPHIKMEDTRRKLAVKAAQPSESGWHDSLRKDDVIQFNVQDEAPPLKRLDVPDVEKSKCTGESISTAQQCKLLDSTEYNYQLKDEGEILSQDGIEPEPQIKWEMPIRTLSNESSETPDNETNRPRTPDDHPPFNADKAEQSHSEVYKGETYDDTVQCTVDMKVTKMNISAPQGMSDEKAFEEGCLTDLGEISEKKAQIFGHGDVSIVQQQHGENMMSNLTSKEQFAQLSKIPHKEVLTTETKNQSVMYQDQVKAPSPKPVKFAPLPETGRTKTIESGMPLVLQCEISEPDAPVCWFKDGIQLQTKNGLVIQSEDRIRRLVVPTAELCHTGVYNCEAMDDVIKFKVYVKAAQLKGSTLTETEKNEMKSDEADNASAPQKEPLDSTAQVCWYRQEQQQQIQECLTVTQSEEIRSEEIKSAELSDSGVYSYKIKDTNMLSTVDPPAPTVMFSTVTEAQRNKSAVVGEPFELECEVSDAAAYVCWYKDGNELSSEAGVLVTSEGTIRKLSVQSAELCHSGTYNCKTDADAVTFNVDIKASSTRFKPLAEMERNRSIELDSPTVPKYEISDSESQVCWYNDGTELLSDSGLNTQRDGNVRKLTVQSTELSDTGHFICGSPDDAVSFKMASQATPIRFSALPDVARNKFIEAGCPIILQCEISESAAQVSWFKDGVPLLQETGLDIKSEGTMRALIIQSAELKHSGTYSCEAGDDRIAFKVDVAASPVRFTAVPETEKTKSFEAGSPIILQCEISEPTALVQWYKDGTQLFPQSGVFFQSEHTMRTLVILSATFSHSGVYSCSTADDISEFYVDIKAPAVTFVYIPKEELHRNVVEQDKLFLCCEVSRSDAITQWYKDGVEIQTCNKVIIETENTMRKLIIPSVQMSDAGTYTCRAGGSALIFKVNVREPPVMIVYPKEDVHLDRHVPEEIVLSCELSRPNGKVTWFKDGQKLQESENMKLKTEGPYRRLKILHSRVEDSGEYVCDTADDSKFFHLSIKEPPVRIVSPSQSQMELCQQMSERMVLSCEISRANASVRWYRNGLEVEENNNLILEVDGIYRRLIIPETTVSDSAEYVCDTADDSVTFFVNIAEPPVRFIRPRKMAYEVEKFVGETIVLDCEVSRSNAEVSWKKNGEEIEENSNITITEDGCTRQLTIHSSRLEDTGQYLCDAKDDVMDFSLKINDSPLKFLHKSAIITDRHFVVSDAIVLKCELSRANGVVCWYKDNNRIVLNDHVTFEEEGAFRSLIILNAEIGDTGEYICNAKDDELVFNITVQEAPVSILRNPRTPEHYSLVAGNELILECEVSRENATVHWLCNGKVLQADARINIERRGTMRKLVLSNLQVSDSGEYICDAIDDKMNIMVTVQEPPFKFIKKEEINIDAYEEESVTLCAEVNRDNGSVQWSKGGKKISDHRFYATSDGPTHYLTINHLKKSDAGEYECDVGTDKAHFSIQVKAMKVKFSKPLQNIVGLKGSDAVLRCELHKSKGDVQWLKNNQEITPNRHFTIRADGQERSLTIHNITDDDEGEYTCESKDERTCATLVVKTPRVVEFIAELHNITVMEGEDATFKCVVSPEDAKMVWCRNGWPITSNERFKISSNGLCHMLYIRNCQVSDSCKLTAEAEGVISKAILQVQEKQVLFTKKMESVVAEEFGEATLEVELSLECGEVQWMRQGVVIHPGPKFAPKQCGQKRMLTIHKLALSDRGTYSCETLHDRTQAVLSVEPRKVKIRKGLREIQTFERETASFEVELTHSNVEGMWLKDGNRLKSNNHWRMTTKGRVHSLTIANLSLEDTGTYTFSTENARSSARLTVKEIPVSILKKLEDSTFPEGTGATLECELSKYNVTVKWTKNGEELKPGKNHRIYSMGRKCFLQILRCELGDSGVYVCDAGDATTSCSVEVYERDLEVLHSLEDLDIQEDQNAVFMCEVSLDDVPGEWFKNGEKIKPTSTIRIRQEGTKHFLLMCNVKEEDSGEIKFVAKNVESVAYLEVERLPVNIVKPLQDKTALENTRVLLDCTVSNPRCSIRWYKGRNVILPSERFEICSEGCYRKLVIQEVTLEDAGMYSVQVGENTSSARLTVEAQPILMVQELQDVEVSAPEEACFMCEVSVPVVKSPMWTLNGEVLRPGPKVLLERMETVHKLTLKHTSEDMNGVVVFDSGKAKSTANLRVKK